MTILKFSVGNKGRNIKSDVIFIQSLLNSKLHLIKPLLPLQVDGKCGALTIGVIKEYQRRVLGHHRPDGRIDPNGQTIRSLKDVTTSSSVRPQTVKTYMLTTSQVRSALTLEKITNTSPPATQAKCLSEADFQRAAAELGIEVAIIKAVGNVESKSNGFLPNNKPKILFEGHWFRKFTQGKYDKTHPNISYSYRGTDRSKKYMGGEREYDRLDLAASLDTDAALMSTSWGRFQIMGFNYKAAGYPTVNNFVQDMNKSEYYHLMAFLNFIKSKNLIGHLKTKAWRSFAIRYNGSDSQVNAYESKLAAAYEAFKEN